MKVLRPGDDIGDLIFTYDSCLILIRNSLQRFLSDRISNKPM